MREIGAFEAKTKLSELLDLIEAGQEVLMPAAARPWPVWWHPMPGSTETAPKAPQPASAPGARA